MIFWLTISYLFIACLAVTLLEPFFKKKTPEASIINTLVYSFGWPIVTLAVVVQIVAAICLMIVRVLFQICFAIAGKKP